VFQSLVTLLGVVLLAPGLDAQEANDPGPLITDRPDFTESALSVPAGRLQIEGGYTWSRQSSETSHSIGELLLRFGILRGFEARLGLNSFVIVERPGADLDGLKDISVGTKLDAVELFGWPRTTRLALIAATAVPSGNSETGSTTWNPEAILAFSFDISDRVGLGSNAGLRFPVDDGGRFIQGMISVAFAYGLSDRWGTYAEAYALLPEGSRPDELFLNAGVTFLTSDDFQFDARVGSAVAGNVWPNVFAGIGASWRI
jgi:hypothetical protein